MRRFSLALLAACLPCAAFAQTIGEPLPGQAQPREPYSRPAPQTAKGARPCPEYGAGYVRIEGSSTCVRLGGGVRAEFGKSSHSGYGQRTDGMVYLESRTDTALGPMRSVIAVRGGIDRNLNSSSPFRY
ncbi:porin [Bosea sp. (in: a-proteobacteria)]|uniref:porin n=1 Tax=Bosea sp. (in: a-proteobacteria) TaxID=1871050 RepID=UPI003B3B5972